MYISNKSLIPLYHQKKAFDISQNSQNIPTIQKFLMHVQNIEYSSPVASL